VAFLIVPLFAFANAGVTLEAATDGLLGDSVVLGVVVGLFLGKPLGVLAFSWLAQKTGLGELAGGVGWTHVAGAAALCGVGFTMSLFIAGLAFDAPEYLAHAKVGILLGSALSALLGALLIRAGNRSRGPA
jgi:NhaA family Na+:H+ antiporter